MHAASLGRIAIVKYLVEEAAAQVDSTDRVSYIVSMLVLARHLHVGMTPITNGGYFRLKTNYRVIRVYLFCLEFLLGFNYPNFFSGVQALPS